MKINLESISSLSSSCLPQTPGATDQSCCPTGQEDPLYVATTISEEVSIISQLELLVE